MDDWWSEPTYTHPWYVTEAPGRFWLVRLFQRLMNLRFWRCRRAGFNCRYWLSFGFVPEAGCPYHDPD